MSELLSQFNQRLITSHALLGGRLLDCLVVDALRWSAIALVLFWLIKCAAHTLMVKSLVRKTLRFEDPQYKALLLQYRELVSRVGLRKAPPLYQSPFPSCPAFTVGLIKPLVFLHPRMITNLDREELSSALTHELVHVKRRDNLKIWRLDFALNGMPLLWLLLLGFDFSCKPGLLYLIVVAALLSTALTRQLMWAFFRSVGEHTCDDRVVSITGAPLPLASALIKTWKMVRAENEGQQPWSAAYLLLVNGACVETRVRRLVAYRKPHLLPMLSKALKMVATSLILGYAVFLWQYHINKSYLPVVAECSNTVCVAKAHANCPSP